MVLVAVAKAVTRSPSPLEAGISSSLVIALPVPSVLLRVLLPNRQYFRECLQAEHLSSGCQEQIPLPLRWPSRHLCSAQ